MAEAAIFTVDASLSVMTTGSPLANDATVETAAGIGSALIDDGVVRQDRGVTDAGDCLISHDRPRHRSEFGLPCVGDVVTISVGAGQGQIWHIKGNSLALSRPKKMVRPCYQTKACPRRTRTAAARPQLCRHVRRIGPSGKRPRFRLSTHQTHLASYLPEIEAALRAIGEAPSWLVRPNRSVPFPGSSPVKLMAERDGEGMA